MQSLDRMNAIEARARAINLSVWRVCQGAEVDYSNWSRWRKQACSPTERVFDAAMSKLERQLDHLERQLYERLSVQLSSRSSEPRLPFAPPAAPSSA